MINGFSSSFYNSRNNAGIEGEEEEAEEAQRQNDKSRRNWHKVRGH
jgi:hypothetical protein